MTTTILPGQWRMNKIEVYNWGTFQGFWELPITRQGFLITGPSGSGKSSLLDAVSTVLVPRGEIRFNAAAHDSSARGPHARSLVSYVRGAFRRGTDTGTGEVVSHYLRDEATFSAIKLSFGNGVDADPIVLIKLYYLRRGAMQNADVQEQSIILRDDRKITEFGKFIDSGINVRQLKRGVPEAELITDRHSTFANRFKRMLNISGDNALKLLHRTQSAKSLGNLDDLFRSFMLDEPRTFQLATTAKDQFHELSQAYETVVDARQQRDALTALQAPAEDYETAQHRVADNEYLLSGLEDYTTLAKFDLVSKAAEKVRRQLLEHEGEYEIARQRRDDAIADHNLANQFLLEAGGGALQSLEDQIQSQQNEVTTIQQARHDLQQKLMQVQIELPYTWQDFEELRTQAKEDIANATARRDELRQQLLEVGTQRGQNEVARKELQAELRSLQASPSNMPLRLQQARQIIAQTAGIPEKSLPFAGELMEVRSEYHQWTGAIERVLRPLATTLLVPQAHRATVLDTIDRQYLGARIVAEVVPNADPSPKPVKYPNSIVNRVHVPAHPMQAWIHAELTHRYDYEAVEDARQFGDFQHAVTRAGQVRRGATRYEKDDRHRVDDPSHWVMGLSNHEKYETFATRLQELTDEYDRLDQQLNKIQQQQDHEQLRLHLLRDVETLRWESIDTITAELRLSELQDKLVELQSSNTDLIEAQRRLTEATSWKSAAERTHDEKLKAVYAAQQHLETLAASIDELQEQASSIELSSDLSQRLEALFVTTAESRRLTHDKIDRVSRQVTTALHKELQHFQNQANTAASRFQELAQAFRNQWESVAANLTVYIDDRQGYHRLLENIISDGLPRFEERFFELLRTQSQNNVASLASEIRGNLSRVQDRVAPINASLARSEFNPGTYLDIVVLNNQNDKAREFLADLHTIASGSWGGEDDESAESRFHIMNGIMQKIDSSDPTDVSWRRQVLDTRFHVRFRARELDGSGVEVDAFDSSAGLSGGQQQKLVTFCLAAALRYQLAGVDADVPGFGTVMMDEAFDKADSRFTRLAMDIFQEFGFHMVLATPLKLLETLDAYIDGTAVISIEDARKSSVALVEVETTDRIDNTSLTNNESEYANSTGPANPTPAETSATLGDGADPTSTTISSNNNQPEGLW